MMIFMIKVLIIAPYEELKTRCQRILDTLDVRGLDITVTHIYGTDPMVIKRIDADIVVARGVTGMAIAKQNPQVHVIEIQMSPSALISALAEVKERFGNRRTCFIYQEFGLFDREKVSSLSGMTVSLEIAQTQEDIFEKLKKAQSVGVEVFVGGLTLCHLCQAKKLPYVHIKSDDSSIERALGEAISTARTMERERARTNMLLAIMNKAPDGMLAVNSQGVVIASNEAVSELFGKTVDGCLLTDIYPDSQWEAAYHHGVELERVQQVAGKTLLVIMRPISVDDEPVGVMYSLQNIDQIHEAESKVRQMLYKKGLFARYHFTNILHSSQTMNALIAKAVRYAQAESNVLLIGETGTGKELFAQSIHNASKRSGCPFVAVNCAALPESLLESELFGYVEGAFSGASRGGKAGLFELADSGTLFLDEIGEMPIQLQVKLLRVLQEKEVRRIGGERVIPVNVRVISATNVNISKQVKDGSFRLDLFYRISLLNLRIPPLRDRKEDIGIIFRTMVAQECEKQQVAQITVTDDAIWSLSSYPWPGNVRELRNAAERLVVLHPSLIVTGKEIEALDIDNTSLELYEQNNCIQSGRGEDNLRLYRASPEELYAEYLKSGLKLEDFAKQQGMSRTTLWRKFKLVQK